MRFEELAYRDGGQAVTIPFHRTLTVLGGLDADLRRRFADRAVASLDGNPAGHGVSLVFVDGSGRRVPLVPDQRGAPTAPVRRPRPPRRPPRSRARPPAGGRAGREPGGRGGGGRRPAGRRPPGRRRRPRRRPGRLRGPPPARPAGPRPGPRPAGRDARRPRAAPSRLPGRLPPAGPARRPPP